MPAWLQHDWCSSFVLVLGHFLWQGTLIAIVVAIALRATKKVVARYWLSLAALLLMAACPVVTLGWLMQPASHAAVLDPPPIVREEPAASPPITSTVPFEESTDVGHASSLPVRIPVLTPEATPTAPIPPSTPTDDRSWWQRFAPLVTSLYLSGVALMLMRLAIGLWGGRRLRRRATPVTDVSLLAALQRQAQALGLKLRPALAYCERVAVPTVIGILKPTILLPLALTSGLAPEQVEAVLAHELAHLRRCDHLVNVMQRMIESILFFHPAVWWLSNRIRVEREHCCDDLVVACGAVPLDYAKSLLRVAELSRGAKLHRSVAAVSLLATGQPSTLRQRIARLLGYSAAPQVRLVHSLLVFCLGVTCFLLAWVVTAIGWQLAAEAMVDRLQTTVIVEWSAIVDQSVMNEIRDLKGISRRPGTETDAETIRCSADELRVLLKSRLGDKQLLTLPSSIRSIWQHDGWAARERFFTISGTESIRADDGVGSALTVSWHRNGRGTLDEQADGVRLLIDAKYRCQLANEEATSPSGKIDEVMSDGDAIVVAVTPSKIPKGERKLSAIFVGEAIRIPTSQVELLKSLTERAEDWVRRGATGTKDQIARITDWRSRATGEFATAHNPDWARELPRGGKIELLAIGQPQLAPFIWWDPSGHPISGDDVNWSHRFPDELIGIVRVSEAGVERCPHADASSNFKLHRIRDAQFAKVPVKKSESDDGKLTLDVGAGFGPWSAEATVTPAEKASANVNGLEYRITGVFDFSNTHFHVHFHWEPTRDIDVGVVAVKKDGQVVAPFQDPTIASHDLNISTRREFAFQIPLSEIDHLVIKTRPRQWTKFTGFVIAPTVGLNPPFDFANPALSADEAAAESKVSTESIPAEKPKYFGATLPDGRSVELVGITKNTAPANEGWKPNGLPIGDVGHWTAKTYRSGNTTGSFVENGDHPEPNAGAIDLLFRFRGLKAQPSLTFELAADGVGYSHLPVKDPYELRITTQRRGPRPPDANWSIPDGEMEVGLTDEPWGKWLQISPKGEVLNPLTDDDLYRSHYDQIQIVGVEPHERAPNKLALVLRQPGNLRQPSSFSSLFAFEVRGIDSEEKSQWVVEWENQGVEGTNLREGRWGLALTEKKSLSRFEYRLRPYRHWVTFKGVSLEPGQQSDVKVDARTVPAEARAKDAPIIGKILKVDDNRLTVWITVGKDDGVKPRMTFEVREPKSNEKAANDRRVKGTIEVVRILSPNLAEARIVAAELNNGPAKGDDAILLGGQVADAGISQWGETTNGLRTRIVPVLSSMSEDMIDPARRLTKFEKAEDVAFIIELENVSDKPIKLVDLFPNAKDRESSATSHWLSQFVFSVDLFDLDGKRIDKPEIEVDDIIFFLHEARVLTLQPGKTQQFLIKPTRWLAAFQPQIRAGNYRVAVRYHWLATPNAARTIRKNSELLEAAAVNVASAAVAIEITGESRSPDLVWGDAVNGLRAAVSFEPSKPTFSHGEKPVLRLHLQNVGTQPLKLISDLSMPAVSARIKNDKGERVDLDDSLAGGRMGTGIKGLLTLKPQQIAVLDAGGIGLAISKKRANQFDELTLRKLVAPAGKYSLQLESAFQTNVLNARWVEGQENVIVKEAWVGKLTTGSTPLTITTEVIECDIVDAVTGKPIAQYALETKVPGRDKKTSRQVAVVGVYRFIKPKTGNKPEKVLAIRAFSTLSTSHITLPIPDDIARRPDFDELFLELSLGAAPVYQEYEPAERIPLTHITDDKPQPGRASIRTIKLVPKKQAAQTNPTDPLKRPVSLVADDVPLKTVLEKLAADAGLLMEFDVVALKVLEFDMERPVSAKFENVPLSQALGRVIDWQAYFGAMPEVRGNKLVLTTHEAWQRRIVERLPEWMKPLYNNGLLATLNDDNEVVSVTTGRIMTDDLIARLAALPRLKELSIEVTKGITPAGLAHLARCQRLENLSLYSINEEGDLLGDDAMRMVSTLPELRQLSITECGLTDVGAALLERMPQLTSLRLGDGRLTDVALKSVGKLLKLKSLELVSYGGSVRNGRMSFSGDGIRQLAGLENLESLSLIGHDVPADGLPFPKLTSLSLGNASVDDKVAKRIGELRDLTSMELSYCGITDAGLSHIATLPKLQRLDVNSSLITDAGIEHFRSHQKLEHISLRVTGLTDQSLEDIAQIKTLTRLDLNASGQPGVVPGRNFSMTGLQHLKKLPHLETLWMDNFELQGGYAGLKELSQLRVLTMSMCNIRNDELEALEEALPNTRISHMTGGKDFTPKKLRKSLKVSGITRDTEKTIVKAEPANVRPQAELANADLKRFEGTWAVDSLESEAASIKISYRNERWRWTIKGNEFVWGREGQEWKLEAKIDSTASPKQIDLTFLDGPHKGKTCLGIYELSGDDRKTLRIQMQDPAAVVGRPTDFAWKAGSQTSLIALRSIPPIDPVKELASFQGTWCWDFSQLWTWPQPIGVGTDSNGRKSEKRWVIEGNRITWVGRDGERVYVSYTIDPFKTPKQIEFTFLSGPDTGKKSIGIYEPKNGDADNLWLCMTDPGSDAPRPTDISAGSLKKQSMISIYKVIAPAKRSAANELKRLQGVWPMQLCDSTHRTFGGTQQEVSKWQWIIKDDEILWSRQGDVWKLKLNVDPSKRPREMDLAYLSGPFEMDLTFLTGPFQGAKCQGIYGWGGVDGQSLMIAIQDPGSDAPRPTKWSMNSDVQTGLMILRPDKPSDAEREIGALQGTWTLRNFDTGNFDRNKDPSSWPMPRGKGPDKSGEGSELKWIVKGNEIYWTSRDDQAIKASFTFDPKKRPKQIDVTFLSGPNKGETCPGIYQRGDLDEKVLWICIADPGSTEVRPKEFSYQWGEGRSVLSLYPFGPAAPQVSANSAATTVPAATIPEKPISKELKAFEGYWVIDALESQSPILKIEYPQQSWRWTIKGNEIVWGREGQKWKLAAELDPSTTPKQIDFTFLDGPNKGEKCLAIYEWSGDEGKKLRIRMQDPGANVGRPTDFELKKGSQTSLIALRSIPPIDPVKELASFQGTWCFDTLQFRIWPEPIGIGTDSDGRKSEKRMVVKGNQITWTDRQGEEITVSFTIDPFQTPKQIDFTFLRGPNKGAKSLGIYEPQMGNDKYLWLCMTNPGSNAPRPIDVSFSGQKQQSMIGMYQVAPPEKPSNAKALERFQGVWNMTLCDSALRNYGDTQEEASKWQWTIKGDEVLWNRQGEVWKLKLDVDPSKRPREMDLTYLTGPFQGEKCLGMYEFGGIDEQCLNIAIQDPGAKVPRPQAIAMTGHGKTGLIFLRPSQPSDSERQIGAFQGTWTLRNFDTGKNNDKTSWPMPKGKGPDKSGAGSELRWMVKGNEISWTSSDGQAIKASFTFDPAKRPKQIDLTFLSGPNTGETCPGIYHRGDLDENILWLCMADPGSNAARPKTFSYQFGEGRSVLSLYLQEQPASPTATSSTGLPPKATPTGAIDLENVAGVTKDHAIPKKMSGHIKGTILVDGTVPAVLPAAGGQAGRAHSELLNREWMITVRERPTKMRDESLLVSKEQGLANAVVYLKSTPQGFQPEPRSDKPFVLTNEASRFAPRLAVMRAGQSLWLKNADTQPESFKSMPLRGTAFNMVVAPGTTTQLSDHGFSVSERFPVEVTSQLNYWKKAFVLPLDHPFAAVTDEAGRFEITGLPAGQHDFIVWHERTGYLEKKLTVAVKTGETTNVPPLRYEVARFKPQELATGVASQWVNGGEGWSVGIHWTSGRNEFVIGKPERNEPVTFQLSVRNDTDQPLTIPVPESLTWDLEMMNRDLLNVRMHGAGQKSLTLAAREVRMIHLPQPTLNLADIEPGYWQVRFTTPLTKAEPILDLWLDSPTPPWLTQQVAKLATVTAHSDDQFKHVRWGESLQGLRLGMRVASDPVDAASETSVPVGTTTRRPRLTWLESQSVKLVPELFVWNTTETDVEIATSSQTPRDGLHRLFPDEGAHLRTRPSGSAQIGPEPKVDASTFNKRHRLKAGSVLRLGETSLQVIPPDSKLPLDHQTAKLPSHEYGYQMLVGVQRTDQPHLRLNLPSGIQRLQTVLKDANLPEADPGAR